MAIATSATFVITTNLKETMSERVIAEDVWFNTATGTVDVYMRNVGKVDIHVSNVYVNHTSQSYNWPFNLKVNRHGWLTIVYRLGFWRSLLRRHCHKQGDAHCKLLQSDLNASNVENVE